MYTLYTALLLCALATAAPTKPDAPIDVDRILGQLAAWKPQHRDEGKPWSKDSQTNFISKIVGSTAYVNCISSGSTNKGCPIEFPWNNGGCSPNLPWNWNKGFITRKCEKKQVPDAFWDAGSLTRRVYETDPINMDPAQYTKLMENPRHLELLEKLKK